MTAERTWDRVGAQPEGSELAETEGQVLADGHDRVYGGNQKVMILVSAVAAGSGKFVARGVELVDEGDPGGTHRCREVPLEGDAGDVVEDGGRVISSGGESTGHGARFRSLLVDGISGRKRVRAEKRDGTGDCDPAIRTQN